MTAISFLSPRLIKQKQKSSGTGYDIRVNRIAPGPINDTPGLIKLDPREMKASNLEPLCISLYQEINRILLCLLFT
ncbi:hypothetical protein C5167_048297 [Papaver somniferum]|uniref:Uncharacterized protein n=1 Tax=Papaver somniferum TaxID=3469 RepID=A0A4Y7KKG8_PAPSO|nr:hypothetical protein C5167_048297 [Papaver somniferum]